MAEANQQQHPDSPIYMGIDAGTSGLRACCIDDQAKLLAQAELPFPAPNTHGIEISQDPNLWSTVLFDLIHRLNKYISYDRLAAIAIDGTSGTVLFCDAHGNPTSPALMYNDARSDQQVAQLKTLTDNATVLSVSAGLPKLLWLIENTPQDTATHLMHQADWLNFQLTRITGLSDVNNCLKTGYDPVHQQWPDWFSALPALQARLPLVHRPGEPMATISADVAELLKMPTDTQIVAGTTDSHAAILATGINQPGEAVTSLGSSLVVKVICETPIFNQQYGIYSQPFGDYWLVGGGSNSGGAVLREYFTDSQMKTLSQQINPQRDTELNYYPLLTPGERFPVNDPDLKPQLSPRPDNDEIFLQGLFEGIARIEYSAYQKLAKLGAPYPSVIYTAGGGAKNLVWREIRQRYCQTKIKQSQYTDACYGSALLAKHGFRQK